jgi:hypothetical protein
LQGNKTAGEKVLEKLWVTVRDVTMETVKKEKETHIEQWEKLC